MSFVGRSWRYVARKRIKTIIIFAIFLAMSTVLMSANAVSRATDATAAEIDAKTGQGFVLGNNPQFNTGTPRGAGNVKPADIKKIAGMDGVENYVARQNVTADLVDAKAQKLDRQDYDETKEAQFGNAVNVWGVNDTKMDNNFRSGALKLVAGRHLNAQDKNKSIINEDLAKANHLTIGSKLKLKGNPYDADNQNHSTNEVTTEIVGLVSGSNADRAVSRNELFSNTVFTDLDTTRTLYNVTPATEIYQDANFFVKKGANFDDVVKAASTKDIDWRSYQLSRSTQYLSGITGAIDGVRSVMNTTTIATFVLAGAILALVLCLWLNERKKETGTLLSMGVTKASIMAQYGLELIFIAVPAFVLSYFGAGMLAQGMGTSVLSSVNHQAAQEMAKAGQFGADMESSASMKTLEKLTVDLSLASATQVAVMVLVLIAIVVVIASLPMLRKSPRALLVDNK